MKNSPAASNFARNPGASNRDWVHFDDLPEATRKALWERDFADREGHRYQEWLS